MLSRSEKEAIIQDLSKDIGRAKAIFLTNLIGIKSNEAVSVRKAVRDSNGKMVVTRNTLFKKAAAGTPAEALVANLSGPHALAFAFDDPAAVAKSLKEAGASLELVELKGGVLDGQMLTKAQVKQLADLPSRDQMLGTLLATFLAPVSAFARVLYAIQEKKEKGELA
ncbi:MAG: 50S ribosomal protein L10 [Bacteriovoracaceae bacterium]|jgi:large subunit ribosomal protein L10|nr:50S ribosomal protein L10 [Bacteriovoracaceae bacterium]